MRQLKKQGPRSKVSTIMMIRSAKVTVHGPLAVQVTFQKAFLYRNSVTSPLAYGKEHLGPRGGVFVGSDQEIKWSLGDVQVSGTWKQEQLGDLVQIHHFVL